MLDLFSGIGGFSLGLEKAGMETVAFCENDAKCRQVLTKHWPTVPQFEDVKELSKEVLDEKGITDIGLICGGFPCQDISAEGGRQVSALKRAADCGANVPVCLGKFDLNTPSLKTSQICWQDSGELGFDEYCGTFPRSGLMLNGTVYQLPNLAMTITEIGSGLLPTPSARDGKDLSRTRPFCAALKRKTPSLTTMLLQNNLHWTLVVNAYEAMMGYPQNHTEIESINSAMPSCRKSPKS